MPLNVQPVEFRSWKAVPRLGLLKSVELLRDPPSWARDSRSRGRKAKGRQWERKFDKLLNRALSNRAYSTLIPERGQWFRYSEHDGEKDHYAQLDFSVLGSGRGLVIETKSTRTPDGIKQLLELYRPLVEFVWPDLEWSFCQAFKNWAGTPCGPLFGTLEEMLDHHLEKGFEYADLHWTR